MCINKSVKYLQGYHPEWGSSGTRPKVFSLEETNDWIATEMQLEV